MKKILFAALVMISLSVTASAQKASEKSTEKNRIEKTFKKGDAGKFEKSKFHKDGDRHKMWNRKGKKGEYAKKHGDRKKHDQKFKKGNAKRFSHNGRNRS
ncbi:MAG: hypothetical protein IPI78_07995 [Chitinophagaceae bacterium]|nr:hypothetical protein [Chitinophagaceae bacterium]